MFIYIFQVKNVFYCTLLHYTSYLVICNRNLDVLIYHPLSHLIFNFLRCINMQVGVFIKKSFFFVFQNILLILETCSILVIKKYIFLWCRIRIKNVRNYYGFSITKNHFSVIILVYFVIFSFIVLWLKQI